MTSLLPPKTKLCKATDLLKLLASEPRLTILCLLHEQELSVGELEKKVRISQSALSQHLAKLREQKIVATRKEAQTVYYRVIDEPTMTIIKSLHDIYCA